MAFPGDWGRKVVIEIDSGLADANLTNFPIVLTQPCLPDEVVDSDEANKAQSDGGDLRFYTGDFSASDPATEDTDRIACEIVDFTQHSTPGSATVEIWVNIPSISSSTGATITMYYNATGKSQPAVGASYGRNAVWDSDFWGVYHMTGTDSEDEINSAGTAAYDMEAQSDVPVSIRNPWGTSRDFLGGTGDYLEVTDANTNDTLDGLTALTAEGWCNLDVSNVNLNIITKWDYPNNKQFTLFWSNSFQDFGWEVEADGSDDTTVRIVTPSSPTGNWYHIAGTWQPSYIVGYIDGAPQNGVDPSATVMSTNSVIVAIGSQYTGSNLMNGQLDEVRLSTIVRTAEWIKATYLTANSPETYAVRGTPGDVPPSQQFGNLYDEEILPDGKFLITSFDILEAGDTIELAYTFDVPAEAGSRTWGHDTSVDEDFISNFTGLWTGTGSISGSGDSEILELNEGEYLESNTVEVGSGLKQIERDKYGLLGFGSLTIEYKTGTTESNCDGDSWHAYGVNFTSTGWIKIKVSRAA